MVGPRIGGASYQSVFRGVNDGSGRHGRRARAGPRSISQSVLRTLTQLASIADLHPAPRHVPFPTPWLQAARNSVRNIFFKDVPDPLVVDGPVLPPPPPGGNPAFQLTSAPLGTSSFIVIPVKTGICIFSFKQ